MINKILSLIEEYDSIIIARHKNPDLDAYGSQFGLYYALRERYPNKNIYAVGDTNYLNKFKELDEVDDNIYKKSLVFILDTVVSQLIDYNVYKSYDKLVLIDHHKNDPNINYDLAYQVKDASSCSEIITELLMDLGIPISKTTARALYMGIIGDTARFLHSNTSSKTLRLAAELLDRGIDITDIHNSLYTETKKSKNMKNIFFNKTQYTSHSVAYNKNDVDFLEKYDLTTNYASRGLVNQMGGMEEVEAWVNFTFNKEEKNIICELRSKRIPVLSIAKKYGGGGHLKACGCTLNTWAETDKLIEDLDKLMEENNG